MSNQSRAFWVAAPGRGELRTESLLPARPGEVVVRALYSGVSRGSESLVFAGRVPESEHQRMRAPFQSGDFPAPVKYGYASVGQVELGPADLMGCVAFVLFPHQTRYLVPVEALHLVPEGVPPARAVLAANLETAINGIWDARVQPGDRVAVVGAGVVGCLIGWLAARIPGCEVELIDVNPTRAAVAAALGARFALPAAARSDADVVFHASGSPAGLDLALSVAGRETTVIEMSWYGDRVVPVSLGGAFHSRRLTIRSSQVGMVATSQRARWDTKRRMQLALSQLADPALDVLITGECAFDELPEVMAGLAAMPGDALCQRVRYTT
jgi:hypothetical protein